MNRSAIILSTVVLLSFAGSSTLGNAHLPTPTDAMHEAGSTTDLAMDAGTVLARLGYGVTGDAQVAGLDDMIGSGSSVPVMRTPTGAPEILEPEREIGAIVPEPATAIILTAGGAMLLGNRRRRRSADSDD
jgi:hypothetical protein